MELSEVIAILKKNPNKVYESNMGSIMQILTKCECLVVEIKNGERLLSIDLERNWQEVKQPVTWKEALHAWIDGKDIHCEMDDTNLAYSYKGQDFSLLDYQNVLPISRRELIFGKWYID